ncbi:MAG: hypothetical protein KDK71_03170 [Chlamydiia bacterium]|nr:hypothetical protein [Chlamydiia bacterium]
MEKAMKVPHFQLLENISSEVDADFKDTYMICVQHLVASTVSLFNALFKKGLFPSHLSVIGKCYSTRPEAYAYMRQLGIDVAEESLCFSPNKPFDSDFRKTLKSFFLNRLTAFMNSKCSRLIILDDGGELLKIANRISLKQRDLKKTVVGVEQTTAGYEKLKNLNLKFPIVNVARSNVKLFHESPFIAKIAAERMIEHLNKLKLYPKSALIIGNGAVGSHMYQEIKDLYRTQIYDQKYSKSSIRKLVLVQKSCVDVKSNFHLPNEGLRWQV